MPDSITPSNPNIPAQAPPAQGNVASLANKDTLSNLTKSQSPKTFGDQAVKAGIATVTVAATQTTIARLYKEKANLVAEGIQLDIDHQLTLQKIEVKHTPKKQVKDGQTVDIPAELNDEEYQKAIEVENKNYEEAKKNLQERKDKNQKDIDDYLKDPFKKQKDAKKKRQANKNKRIKRTKEEKRRANKARSKSVLQNAKKSLVPILTLVLTNQIANIIAGNDRIGKLVRDTNAIITDANESGDPTKLSNAKIARDNAIKIIQDNEDKINKINTQIQRISIYITIFSVIVNIIGPIILSLPVPSPAPDVTTVPKETFRRKVYEPTLKLLNGLSALLPIIINVLDKAISILRDYKAQLLDINGQLESSAASGDTNLLNSNGANGAGSNYGTVQTNYKGFTFALKEENNPKFNVRGNKRHYAVAINKQNVEQLKSDSSFTLDPNDLIEQLKLIIDQQNLQS
jgi:hypothetical protein